LFSLFALTSQRTLLSVYFFRLCLISFVTDLVIDAEKALGHVVALL
jgi:hypothetical protein